MEDDSFRGCIEIERITASVFDDWGWDLEQEMGVGEDGE